MFDFFLIKFSFTADEKNADKSVTIQTPNKQCRVKLLAIPLPKEISDLLDKNVELLKSASQIADLSDRMKNRLTDLRESLIKEFQATDENAEIYNRNDLIDCIWAFGPKKCGSNILLNLTDFNHQSAWTNFKVSKKLETSNEEERDVRTDLESSFLSGYQLATLAGPLTEEPLHGVCFVVDEWSVDAGDESSISIGSLGGE